LTGLRRLGGRRRLRGLRGTLGAGGLDDVLLADPAADPGPGDRLQVHGVLGGQLADQRGDVRRVAGAGQRRRRRVLLGLGFGRRWGRGSRLLRSGLALRRYLGG
jgi:hypothetical protein